MERQLDRRRFLGAAVGTGAAAGLGAFAPAALGKGKHGHPGRGHGRGRGGGGKVPRDRIGMQLYSMRRIMDRSQQDAANLLYALGEMGYTEVETAGHYGWTPAEFKAVLRRAGLRAVSGHDGFDISNLDPNDTSWEAGYREALEYAAELGQKYTGFAWFPPPYNEETRYRRLAQRFNRAGQLAQEYGLQFFYHNHDFEFSNKQANGEPMYNIFLEETDEDLVKFELDLFWITEGGANPVEYLSADPARYPLYHVKDHVWGDRRKADGSDEADWEDVGPGMLDFPDLFEAGDGRRLDKHFIVEHDWPQLSHPDDEDAEYKTAQAGVDYLRRVRW